MSTVALNQIYTRAEQLDKVAQALYNGEATDETFTFAFTKDELVTLWTRYCVYHTDDNGDMLPTASYDDEVYNALDRYGYWDNK